MDLHCRYGDAAVFLGAEPRFSVVDALENTHRLDEAFFESLVVRTSRARPARLGRARGHAQRRLRRDRDAAGICRRRTTAIRRARRAAVGRRGRSTRSRASATIVIVANQELATVRNAGRMAATLRQRYGKDAQRRAQPVRPAGGDRARRCRARRRLPVKYTVSERLPRGASSAEQGAPARARQRQRAVAGVPAIARRAGRLAACEQPAESAAERQGCSARLGRRSNRRDA